MKGTPTFVLDGQVLPDLPSLQWFVDYVDRRFGRQQVRSRALALILLSFLGLVDTLYLGIKSGKPVPCTITNGCEEVLNSRFSAIAGIPISWFGFAFYLTVFSAAVFASFGDSRLLSLIFWPAPRRIPDLHRAGWGPGVHPSCVLSVLPGFGDPGHPDSCRFTQTEKNFNDSRPGAVIDNSRR